jgi:hypothetical protein
MEHRGLPARRASISRHQTGQAADERKLLPHQITQVMIGSTTRAQPVEVFRTDKMITEAPDWTLDGRWLILNDDGTASRP